MNKLTDLLIKHEGLRLRPYECSAGKTTIGVGRNLTDNGITEIEAMMLLNRDINVCIQELGHYEWFNTLDGARRDAIIDLYFCVGGPSFSHFRKLIRAIQNEDWESAGAEVLDSKFARQTGNRAVELAEMIRTNEYIKR
jgi:lysozyme